MQLAAWPPPHSQAHAQAQPRQATAAQLPLPLPQHQHQHQDEASKAPLPLPLSNGNGGSCFLWAGPTLPGAAAEPARQQQQQQAYEPSPVLQYSTWDVDKYCYLLNGVSSGLPGRAGQMGGALCRVL